MQSGEVEVAAQHDGGESPTPPLSPSSLMEKERQIPVDPMSLRNLGDEADGPLSAPSVLTEVVVQSPLLPPLRRPTFVGGNLLSSASSSPVHGHHHPSPPATPRSLARQHSAALSRFAATLSRSESYAEGKTMTPGDGAGMPMSLAAEDGFKCGALCMYLPVFSKKKATVAAVWKGYGEREPGPVRRSSVSRVASLERFECGSWSSPPLPPSAAEEEDGDEDFAMEVAKNSCGDDTEAPVKMAFVFDGEPRGILKKAASTRQDSNRSSHRHVRFSTTTATTVSCPSSPSSACITPRLMRARAEFNAFLEAQIV